MYKYYMTTNTIDIYTANKTEIVHIAKPYAS